MCVRPHVDEELDKRKHVYRGIDSILVSWPDHRSLSTVGIKGKQSKVAEQISQTVPVEYAESLNVVYFPQLGLYFDALLCNSTPLKPLHLKGFLVTVPMREEWETETGIEVLDGWSFQV